MQGYTKQGLSSFCATDILLVFAGSKMVVKVSTSSHLNLFCKYIFIFMMQSLKRQSDQISFSVVVF